MNKNVIFYNGLKKLITNNVLDIPSVEIDNLYDSWELNKNNVGVANFKYPDSKIHKIQNVPLIGASLKGIDLPTWFGDYTKKKVMILGIDPLRNEKVFKRENADVDNEVIIGTPYALHECKARLGACATYWTFIEGLSKSNFVYCTDIFKTYYYLKETKIRSYNDKEYIESAGHKALLISEIELIKPDVIIAFGNLVENLLISLKISTKIIKLPHPSNANRSWNTLIDGKATPEQKVKHLNLKFNEHFGVSI